VTFKQPLSLLAQSQELNVLFPQTGALAFARLKERSPAQ